MFSEPYLAKSFVSCIWQLEILFCFIYLLFAFACGFMVHWKLHREKAAKFEYKCTWLQTEASSPVFFIPVFLRWLHHGSLLNREVTFSEGVEHSVFFVDSVSRGATLMSLWFSSHFVGWKGAAYTIQEFRCQSCWEIKIHCSAKATQSWPRAKEHHFREGHLWLQADRGEEAGRVPPAPKGDEGEGSLQLGLGE